MHFDHRFPRKGFSFVISGSLEKCMQKCKDRRPCVDSTVNLWIYRFIFFVIIILITVTDVEGHGAALAGEVQKEAEKAQLLKQKITSNASAIPIVLNRMKEGMAKIDKLQSSNKAIHPAFKRARTSR